MEICVDETRVSEEKEQKESSEVFEGDAASDIDQDCAELMRHLEQTEVTDAGHQIDNEVKIDIDVCPADEKEVNDNDDNKNEDNKSDTEMVTDDKVQEAHDEQVVQVFPEANINFASCIEVKSDSEKKVGCETHVELKGVDKDGIAAVKLKYNEERSDSDSDSTSSDFSLEHISNTDPNVCNIETLNECKYEGTEDQKDSNIKGAKECVEDKTVIDVKSDDYIEEEKEQYSEIHKTDDSIVEIKIDNLIEMNIDVTRQDESGGHSETRLEREDLENEKIKEFNMEEQLKPEPPTLKIRIFKGNSGELINEKEAKRIRKRKKKMEKQKVKMAKLTSDKAEKDVQLIAAPNGDENETENRIFQELPRCNWLEQKIKNAGSSKNYPSRQEEACFSQVDALLETDSDDDYLVVDDQPEKNEVTANFKEVSLGHEENEVDDQISNKKKNNQTQSMNKEAKEFPNTMEETKDEACYPIKMQIQCQEQNLEEPKDIEVRISSEEDDIQEIHPFTYMLGNLMKKMDDNKTKAVSYTREEPNTDVSNHTDVNAEGNGIIECKQNLENARKNNTKYINQNSYNKRTQEVSQSIHQKTQEETQQITHQRTTEEANRNLQEIIYQKSKPIQFVRDVEEPKEILFQQHIEKVKPALQKRTIEEAKRESYEKTIEESKVARQNAQNLHFQQQMLENKRIEEQLIKDIENLKNKKIKEMEDLIEIKSKKEQSMTDLEKLKLEIMKNKTFLESLKKINLNEESRRINSPTIADNEVEIQNENKNVHTSALEHQDKNVTSLKPLHRVPQSPQVPPVIDKRLPDLVNHEKFVFKEQKVQQQVAPSHLQHLNLSQDYLKHLQRMQETNNKPLDHTRFPEKNQPPQLYNNQRLMNQKKTPYNPENQSNQPKYTENVQVIAPNNSRPQLSMHNIQNADHQNQVPQLLTNSSQKQDKYGTNPHSFPPTIERNRETNQFSQQRPQQKGIKPVSITRVPTTTEGIQRRPEEVRRENGENKTIPKLVEGGFIRPREFSREAALTPPNEVSRLMNNLNNQYAVRNFLQNLPNPATQPRPAQPNQTRQEIPGNLNFPEIRNAIAAAAATAPTDRNDQHMRNSAPIRHHPDQQRQSPNVLSKCAVCTKVANFLCSGCQNVYYCTVQCQTSHWLSHYIKCKGATN
eukprot:GFUD01028577.1.p1 GENE.GFUD01028577.1~~GFUD01028577.1.p1  ORF type:complete len:1214 (+),score=381.50 GFUD01028577.1:175-3642(+)